MATTMSQLTVNQPTRVQGRSFTARRPAIAARTVVCGAQKEQKQVARSASVAGIAAAVLGAAAGLQVFITPAADAIATQTDMYARPQLSDQNKGQKTGQPDQQKPAGSPGSGALAASGAAEKGGLPDNDLADENSRLQRSTSGSRAVTAEAKQ